MRDKNMTYDDFSAEMRRIWEDMVRQVYRKEAEHTQEIIDRVWEGTRYTPLEYISTWASPSVLTNQVADKRTQKARERRWDAWIEKERAKERSCV